MSEQARRYPGVYAAMPSPLTEDRAVDRAGVRRVAGYLIDQGIDGLSILGSTGECSALSRDQRRAVLDSAMDEVGDRTTVFGGAAGTVVSEVIADLRALDGTGVRGALVPPPFYYPLNNDGVIDFYERIADASPVPVFMYSIPRMTKIQISVEAVARLSEHPNIIGIKDSSGDFRYFSELARLAKPLTGFTVLTGSDAMLAASLVVGGHGIIGGGVNVVPDLAAGLYQAFIAGNIERALEYQPKIADAVEATRIGVFPAAIKAALSLKGLCQPYTTRPVPPLQEAELRQLRGRLRELGVLEA